MTAESANSTTAPGNATSGAVDYARHRQRFEPATNVVRLSDRIVGVDLSGLGETERRNAEHAARYEARQQLPPRTPELALMLALIEAMDSKRLRGAKARSIAALMMESLRVAQGRFGDDVSVAQAINLMDRLMAVAPERPAKKLG